MIAKFAVLTFAFHDYIMESTELFNEREAARRLGLSVATLRRRRLNQQSPAWVKLGDRVLYRIQDLESFIEAHLIHPLDTERESKQ